MAPLSSRSSCDRSRTPTETTCETRHSWHCSTLPQFSSTFFLKTGVWGTVSLLSPRFSLMDILTARRRLQYRHFQYRALQLHGWTGEKDGTKTSLTAFRVSCHSLLCLFTPHFLHGNLPCPDRESRQNAGTS